MDTVRHSSCTTQWVLVYKRPICHLDDQQVLKTRSIGEQSIAKGIVGYLMENGFVYDNAICREYTFKKQKVEERQSLFVFASGHMRKPTIQTLEIFGALIHLIDIQQAALTVYEKA